MICSSSCLSFILTPPELLLMLSSIIIDSKVSRLEHILYEQVGSLRTIYVYLIKYYIFFKCGYPGQLGVHRWYIQMKHSKFWPLRSFQAWSTRHNWQLKLFKYQLRNPQTNMKQLTIKCRSRKQITYFLRFWGITTWTFEIFGENHICVAFA